MKVVNVQKYLTPEQRAKYYRYRQKKSRQQGSQFKNILNAIISRIGGNRK